nr:MAG: replication initiator protein [Microvirus sp.]
MKCSDPFVKNNRPYGCGSCEACRISKKRVWAHRIMLEAYQYSDNAFLTLTYANNDQGDQPWSLCKKDVQDFIKRLREKFPQKIRYYLVGEYGDRTFRPHYHAALFNFPTCVYLRTRNERISCCPTCDLVRDVWGFGRIELALLENDSASYVAGYITKKMTSRHDPRLDGRDPEFAIMSLKPGIGFDAMHEVASQILTHNLVNENSPDVPSGLRHGKKILPLGRYLRRTLRKMSGMNPDAPTQTIEAMDAEMLPLLIAAKKDKEALTLKRQLLKKNQGNLASISARAKIHKSRKTI